MNNKQIAIIVAVVVVIIACAAAAVVLSDDDKDDSAATYTITFDSTGGAMSPLRPSSQVRPRANRPLP